MLVALIAVGPALYGAGLAAVSLLDGQSAAEATCFDPATVDRASTARLIGAVAMGLGAVLLVLAAPWLLATIALRRIESKRATAGAWSLAVNSAALILVCLILRHTVGVDRGSFLAAWLVWTGILLLLGWPSAPGVVEVRSAWRRWGLATLIGLAAVIAGMVIFRGEHFLQCFNGDGTEFNALGRSLRDHFLPYWDIETIRRFGTFVANPTWINSYWTLGLQLLLGEGELATRLPCWIWWLGVFGISLRLVQGERTSGAWLPAIPLAMALLLVSVWYTFYVGYYPYMADPANPAVPDALFTLLLLLGWDCLRRGDSAGWAVSMILASLVFYAGVVMFLLTAVAAWLWQPVPRRQLVRATLVGALVIGGVVCGYLLVGYSEGSLWGWWSVLHREVFRKYANPGPQYAVVLPHWCWSLLFVGYFLLGCGGIPALGLLRGFRHRNTDRDVAWDRTAATVAICYLLIILGSGHKNLHYLGPLLPIPLILWLKSAWGTTRTAARSWAVSLSAAGSLAVCIFLCWPVSRPVFTLNRELGAVTTFQTDSPEEACRWGKIAMELYDRGDLAWQVGPHTWADYSQRSAQPAEPRPLLVTDAEVVPPQYELVFGGSTGGVKLYSRDPRITRWCRDPQQRLSVGPDRCPKVFQPIGILPRPTASRPAPTSVP